MPKINRGYDSLFEYLVDKDFPLARWLDEHLYSDENRRIRYGNEAPYGRRWNPNPHRGQQLLGGLQPIADMGKDFVNTFKSYKTARHAGHDFLQPVRGLGNIAKGIGNLVGAPLLFLGNTVRYAFVSGSFEKFAKNMGMNAIRTLSWLTDGISSVIRGVTQIATTPLTWFLKMPLRGIITAAKGAPKIEENNGVQRLVNKGKQAVQEGSPVQIDAIRHELHRKYKKGESSGQKTDIPSDKEDELFRAQYFKYGKSYVVPLREDRATAALKYIGLFSKSAAEQQQSLNANPVKSCGWSSIQAYEKDQARHEVGENTPLLNKM